jgi:hypothetical protein
MTGIFLHAEEEMLGFVTDFFPGGTVDGQLA